jgi:hypothetical protein
MTFNEKRAKNTAGKQRSSLDACTHNLTGFDIVLQTDEMEAYNHLTESLIKDLAPRTELERQTAQKIIDTHFRLNRMSALENNLFQFGVIDHTTSAPHDDRVEVMIAQTRAWIGRSGSFDMLGRYEARLARQLMRYTLEFERLRQQHRHSDQIQEYLDACENEDARDDLASFGKNAPEIVMSNDIAA